MKRIIAILTLALTAVTVSAQTAPKPSVIGSAQVGIQFTHGAPAAVQAVVLPKFTALLSLNVVTGTPALQTAITAAQQQVSGVLAANATAPSVIVGCAWTVSYLSDGTTNVTQQGQQPGQPAPPCARVDTQFLK